MASSIYHLYVASLIFGVLVAFGDVALLANLLDVTQEEFRGTFTAFYNLINGIIFFADSLLGIPSQLPCRRLRPCLRITTGLRLVGVGRAFGALTFITLKEPYKYPSTLRKELRGMMGRLPWIPERGPTEP